MRFLKLAIISFILIFLLITVMSLFIPSRVRISRAINIGASQDAVLALVDNIDQWKVWYPGFDTMKVIPKNVRDGKILTADLPGGTSVVITEKKTDQVIAELRSNRKYPLVSGWKAISYPGSDSITLQWYMDFRLRWYPWEKFASLMLEKNYGTRMEQGLTRLKKVAENKAER